MNLIRSSFTKIAKHRTFEYEQRYSKKEEKLPLEERIQFEKGAILKRKNTLASKRGKLFSHKDKMTPQRKMAIYILFSSMMGTVYFLYKNMDKGWTYTVFFLSLLLLLLIALIRINNQR